MPEGPEIRINCLFVNHVCNGKIFSGKPLRSMVAKSPEIDFECQAYTISSKSRGKELALTLQSESDSSDKMQLLFRFGMSGKFVFTTEDQIPKHAHLQFYTLDSSQSLVNGRYVLSFVDVRRFGSWQMSAEWGKDRGPDVVYEHHEFRDNVLSNLHDKVFNKSICEVLLNQRYFNGIGNYLRAEILHRAKIPPFVCARDVLENCFESCDTPDILQLCYDVPHEVIQMTLDAGKTIDTVIGEQDYKLFSEWLQCYDQQGMKSVKDHNGRTIWFKGAAGPLAPKTTGSCAIIKPQKILLIKNHVQLHAVFIQSAITAVIALSGYGRNVHYAGKSNGKGGKRSRAMLQLVSLKSERSDVVSPPSKKRTLMSDVDNNCRQVQTLRRSARLMAMAAPTSN